MRNLIFTLSVIGFCLVSAICVDAQQSGKRATSTGKRVNKPQPAQQHPQIDGIGIIFKKVSDRMFEEDAVATGLRNLLEKKSSSSDKKLRVVTIKDVADAEKEGVQMVFSVEYLASQGKYFDRGAIGYGTDIKCTFERMDQEKLSTNWDRLTIEKKSSEMEIKGTGSFGIGGQLAELALYRAIRESFNDAIPVLKILKPAAKSKSSPRKQD